MNLVELDHALRKLRLSGMAAVLETRLRQAQSEKLAPIDLVSLLVSDELLRRQTGSSSAATNRRASAIPTARSIPSTSISTRR
jgi:hypothetical protein